MTTSAVASDAISRVDDGVALPSDRVVAEVFDRHCRADADRFELTLAAQERDAAVADACPMCVPDGTGDECLTHFLDYDDAMRRAEDQ